MSMYMYYDKFYYKFGIRKMVDFVAPKILDLNTIVLPWYSSLSFYNMDKDLIPKKDTCRLIKFVKKNDGVYHFPLRYVDPKYEAHSKTVNEFSFIRSIERDYDIRDFDILPERKFFSVIERNHTKLKELIPLLSYNFIHEFYRYKGLPIEEYHKYVNGTRTIFKNISRLNATLKNTRDAKPINHFMVIDLPALLYTKDLFLKYMNATPNLEYVKKLFENELLFFTDLFKLLFTEFREKSALYFLLTDSDREKLLKSITLIIRHNEKGIFLNLHTLLNFVDDLKFKTDKDFETDLKMDGRKVFNLLYFMLKHYYKLPAFTPEDIEKNKHADVIAEKLGLKLDTETVGKMEKKLRESVKKFSIVKSIDGKDLKEDTEDTEDIDLEKVLEDDEDILPTDLEDETEIVETTSYKTKYEDKLDVDKLKQHNPNVIKETEEILKEQLENDHLDKKRYKKFMDYINKMLDKKDPLTNKPIKQLLETKPEELVLNKEEAKAPTKPKVLEASDDEEQLYDTNTLKSKKYLKDIYPKDLVQTILSIQRGGLIVKDFRINRHEDILGAYQELEIDVVDGKSNYTIKTKIPEVDPETGILKISGNSYTIRAQKADQHF